VVRPLTRSLSIFLALVPALIVGVQSPAAAATTPRPLAGLPYATQFEPGEYAEEEAYDVAANLLIKHSITVGHCTASALSWLIPVAGEVRFLGKMKSISNRNAVKIQNAARTESAAARSERLKAVVDAVASAAGRTCPAAIELVRAAWAIHATAKAAGRFYYADASEYINRPGWTFNTCTIDIQVGDTFSEPASYGRSYDRCFSIY